MEASKRTSESFPGGGDRSEPRLPEGRSETAYVILQQGTDHGYWPVETPGTEDGHVRAGSSDAAIKQHLEAVDVDADADLTGRVFVAVPLRSWKPRTIGGVEEVPAKRQFKLG